MTSKILHTYLSPENRYILWSLWEGCNQHWMKGSAIVPLILAQRQSPHWKQWGELKLFRSFSICQRLTSDEQRFLSFGAQMRLEVRWIKDMERWRDISRLGVRVWASSLSLSLRAFPPLRSSKLCTWRGGPPDSTDSGKKVHILHNIKRWVDSQTKLSHFFPVSKVDLFH